MYHKIRGLPRNFRSEIYHHCEFDLARNPPPPPHCKGTPTGSIRAPGIFFFYYSPPVPAPPPHHHQTIWSTFSQCLRIWPILCAQFYDGG